MSAAQTAWSYAARTYLSISEGWLKTGYAEPSIAELPRIMCATLLFLRASHEAYAKERDISISNLEPSDMVAFVFFSKNAIIHGPERITMVTGPIRGPVTPPPGEPLAVEIQGFEIDFDSPEAAEATRSETIRAAAKRYAHRRAERGVQGGLLAEIWDAVHDTAEMINVAEKERARFASAGIPIVGVK